MADSLRDWLEARKLGDLKEALASQGVQDADDVINMDRSDAVAVAVAIGLDKRMMTWRRFMGEVVGDKEVPIPEPAKVSSLATAAVYWLACCNVAHGGLGGAAWGATQRRWLVVPGSSSGC